LTEQRGKFCLLSVFAAFRKTIFFAAISLILAAGMAGAAQAQVKVGSTKDLDPNALLQLGDSLETKGLLLSRVALSSTTSFSPLTAHKAGMFVYNTATAGAGATAVSPGIYYDDGIHWVRMDSTGSGVWNEFLTKTRATSVGEDIYHTGDVGIGDYSATTISGFSVLELLSDTTKGLRLPQLTTSQRDNMVQTPEFQQKISAQAKGLTIFNTTNNCVETWNGTDWISNCFGGGTGGGVATFDPIACGSITIGGNYFAGTPLSGATLTIPVSVSQAGTYNITTNTVNGYSFSGTGSVTGGTTSVILLGTGTPVNVGTDNFILTVNGTPVCTNISIGVSPPPAAIDPIICSSIVENGLYMTNTPLTGTNTLTVPVTVTSAGSYNITTDTVNGYSFSATGNLPVGTTNVVLQGTGTPVNAGTDVFTLTVNGTVACTNISVGVIVAPPGGAVELGGYIWAANNVNTPGTFVPNRGDRGMLYKWGTNIGWTSNDPLQSSPSGFTNYIAVFPPTSTGIPWDMVNTNPCPQGWVVPTQAAVQALVAVPRVHLNGTAAAALGLGNNAGTIYGVPANNSIPSSFNPATMLFIPGAGYRDGSGVLQTAAQPDGYYWTATPPPSGNGSAYYFYTGGIGTAVNNLFQRTFALSCRCVKE
jgi:hypothetical protein